MAVDKKKKIPQIRFRGFSEEWEAKQLGEISTSYSGGTPTVGNKAYYNGTIPFIRSAEINSNATELFITEAGLANSSAKMVAKGDILYALYGATSGNVGRARINGAINQAILAIKPIAGYDTEFLVQWLRSNKEAILNVYLQGGQGNLSAQIIKALIVNYPSQKEQAQIGVLLSQLDKLITLYQEKLALLKAQKQTFLKRLFPKPGSNVPEVRFEGFSEPWEEKKLREITSICTGASDVQDAVSDGAYPFFIRSEQVYRSNKYLFDGEAILIPGEGRLGEIFHYYIGKFDYHQRVYKISDFKSCSGLFIMYYMQKHFKRYATKFTSKATVDSLRLPIIKDFSVSLPSLDEQAKIGAFFSALDNNITLHQEKLTQLKALKQTLLKQMFV